MKLTDDQRLALDALEIIALVDDPTRDLLRDALRRMKWGPKNPATWRSRFRNLIDGLESRGAIRVVGDRVEMLQ